MQSKDIEIPKKVINKQWLIIDLYNIDYATQYKGVEYCFDNYLQMLTVC